ncbi:MAG: carbonic anhydrase, partial [Planctomycetota bacterium]
FADYSTRALQNRVTPQQVLEILREGNKRFHTGNRISRDFSRQIDGTAQGQNPLAVVFSCIDSRVPAELVFDLGIGDIFSVRVAGNIIGTKSLGSIEYGVAVAGAKLVLVMGHTRCGAVTSSVQLMYDERSVEQASGCPHLYAIVREIQQSAGGDECRGVELMSPDKKELCIDSVARKNVKRTVREIVARSHAIRQAVDAGRLLVIGAMYDVQSGFIEFFTDPT